MKACGLIVEYNPLHYGHEYHIQQAKSATGTDIVIAIMSGSFLQRGEPAIIDKVHRAKAALEAGVDIILELPYAYAVQSSELFAKGAVFSLAEIGVTSICFGSEAGNIRPFLTSYEQLKIHQTTFDSVLKEHLANGEAFPYASSKGYEAIGLDPEHFNQPNNILGQSYVHCILKNELPITPVTIKRIHNNYHDETITNEIASATSIRNELLHNHFSDAFLSTIPAASFQQLKRYYEQTHGFHQWEDYFPFLHYKVMTMTLKELRYIHGMEEGLEHRIKKSANDAKSFADWLNRVKTKRYTKTRLQRIFSHILTNTTKAEIDAFTEQASVPYLRMLGISKQGQAYMQQQKKKIQIPIISRLTKKHAEITQTDEKATDTFYSILSPEIRNELKTAELQLPIRKSNE